MCLGARKKGNRGGGENLNDVPCCLQSLLLRILNNADEKLFRFSTLGLCWLVFASQTLS